MKIKNYIQVPKFVIPTCDLTFQVLAYLMKFARTKENVFHAFPSIRKMAEKLLSHPSSIAKCIAKLRNNGFVSVIKRYKKNGGVSNNVYIIDALLNSVEESSKISPATYRTKLIEELKKKQPNYIYREETTSIKRPRSKLKGARVKHESEVLVTPIEEGETK